MNGAAARRAAATAFIIASAVSASGRAAGDDGPAWLREAAAATLTAEQAAQPAVVLLDDLTATVAADGTVTTHRQYAARVLTGDGRGAAALREWYLTDTGRVRQIRGWILQPSGAIVEIDKRRVVDLALAANDVYNEGRMRTIDGGDVEPGSIFGAEVVSQSRALFAQIEWPLQDAWPVRLVRRRLTLPARWRVSSSTFDYPPLVPQVSGTTSTWSAANLPRIREEPFAPPGGGPRLAVSYTPAASSPSIVTFATWGDVARWLSTISDPQAAPDAALVARAKELASRAGTPLERIRALASYVQKVQYISIQIGLGRGGGYQPRPAAQVFARNHGDCKDKATLLRAMLAALGVPSYPVAVHALDRGHVREEWPSPHQFNHAILAVAAGDGVDLPGAAVDAPGLGRVLMVDPTAEFTPVGTLPGLQQGGLALIMAPGQQGLVRLPDAGAEGNRLDRLVEGRLQPGGALAATVTVRARGDAATAEREAAARLPRPEYQRTIEHRIGGDIAGARLTRLEMRDDRDTIEISMHVEAGGYGQLSQNRLLIVTPPFRTTAGMPSLTSAERTRPVLLEAAATSDTLRLEIPAGFSVDELPSVSEIESPFGRYTLSATVSEGQVVLERHARLNRARVAPADYAALRTFLDRIRAADTSPIVLCRGCAVRTPPALNR